MWWGVWSDVEPAVCIDSVDALDRFIDHVEARSQFPTAISVEAHAYQADLLVGHGDSFIHLTPDDPDRHRYFVTVGDPRDGGLDYWLHSLHHTWIESRHLISKEMAREAYREFVLSGTRTDRVNWEEYRA
jgi:hypothetical protein